VDIILRNRKLYRAGGILFKIGMWSAFLLLFGLLSYGLIIIFVALAVVLFLVLVTITLGAILADPEYKAFFDSLFGSPTNLIGVINTFFLQAAIPICVVSCVCLTSSLVFFFIAPKNSSTITKIVFCFIGIAIAVISAFLHLNMGIFAG